MSMYQIIKQGKVIKEYPFHQQATIWCWLKGYVYSVGRYGYILDPAISIKETNDTTRSK